MKRLIFILIVAILIFLALAWYGNQQTESDRNQQATQTERANLATWDAQWHLDLTATAEADK